LAQGVYPQVSGQEARLCSDEARRLLANGIDPGIERKVQKASTVERAANSFEAVAREWFARQSPGWANTHADKFIARLEKDVFPWLGGRVIVEIKAPDVLSLLCRVEARGALGTAHRVHQNCGQVFWYAVAIGRAGRDVSGDLRGALPAARHTHFASVTEPAEVAALLRALDGFQGTFVVQCVLHRCCSSALANCEPPNGRTLTWTEHSGATPSQRPRPSTLCLWQLKQSRSCAIFTRSLADADTYFRAEISRNL
jgi:hypothetical protein